MSAPPDRPNNSGGSARFNSGEVPQFLKDFAYGIWFPALGITAVISALSAPHAMGLQAIKVFLLFGLCAIALVSLFLGVQRGNHGWQAKLNHWSVLALVVHTLYFSFFHNNVVTK